MNRVGGKRNFGWGKQLEWAGKQALRAAYGDGHYATVASHAARWRKYCEWLRDRGIRDARQISREDVAQFATLLGQQTNVGMSTAYAKNQLTSINAVLESLRGDRTMWVKPGNFIGKRNLVREISPGGINRARVRQATEKLIRDGKERIVAVALLCRELGLRRREASVMDLRLANHQATHFARVNIVAGTKGGRGYSVNRWVPVSEHAKSALRRALVVSGNGTKLIPNSLSFSQWGSKVSKEWTTVAKPLGLGPLKDLRAAYACDRYFQITKTSAPVVFGRRIADKDADSMARSILSQELGHNRIDVVAAYIGSAK